MATAEFVVLDTKRHNVRQFDCGKREMNEFLRRYADKNRRLGISSSWVLPVESSGETANKAYYTLTYTTVRRCEIPTDKSLPTYPVPVILLARLAVNESFQGQNLGKKTLVSALRQSVRLTDQAYPCWVLLYLAAFFYRSPASLPFLRSA